MDADDTLNRRDFFKRGALGIAGAGALPGALAEPRSSHPSRSPAWTVLTRRTVEPVVISDMTGILYKNGGPVSCVERAYELIVEGEDVLDALIAGVNIPENDPEEIGVGYGGLPNADGVVQLDACCMHGPEKRAGGVAALAGVRTPSLVARAVMDHTDHHLLVGAGAQEFARMLGFTIEDDLTTERSRQLWLEWKRRVDPEHYLDPERPRVREPQPGRAAATTAAAQDARAAQRAGREAALSMVRDGLIPASSFWGTVNCNGIGPRGEVCGVTTTSGLAWKIPGRVGDSPILGAGLYVDGDVGACGSTGRGEANLYNLTSHLIVEKMRDGMHPLDAGMEGLRRIRDNTVEERLLDQRGEPAFDVRLFIADRQGRTAGVALYGEEPTYAMCTANGAETRPFETLLERPDAA